MDANPTVVLRPAVAADGPAIEAILYDTIDSTWRPNITEEAA